MPTETLTGLDYTPRPVVQKIALAIEQRDMLPLHVGDKLGFARSRINRWITTSGVPDVYQIMLVAQFLDVDAVYLMFDEIPIADDPPKYRDLTKLVAPHEGGRHAQVDGQVKGGGRVAPSGPDFDMGTVNAAVNQLLVMTDALTDVMPEVVRLKATARRAMQELRVDED